MSMVSDIVNKLSQAIADGKHPSKVVMSRASMSQFTEALRRNDEERKKEAVLNHLGKPAIYNDFTRRNEWLIPKQFEIEDPVRKIRVSVPVETSAIIPDGVFVTEYDDKPFEQIIDESDEEKVHKLWDGK